MGKNIREHIVEVLQYVENNGYLKDSLEKKYPLIPDERDRRLLHEVSYGVVRNQIFLNYVINKYLKKDKKIEKDIRHILQVALYQMYFLDRVPNHALVNEAVENAKKIVSHPASGLVNGILRNILRDIDQAFIIEEKDPMKWLSLRYSFPLEWIVYFSKIFSRSELESFLRASNETPPFSIRATGLEAKELQSMLSKDGFISRLGSISEDALIVEDASNIFLTEAYKDGLFYVQDEASQMVAKQFTLKGDFLGLDVCAAPGGKTFQMMEICKGGVIAADVNKNRLKTLRENTKRLKLADTPLEILQHNAGKIKPEWDKKFKLVLVDAPCSGLGLIRRKPEIKNRITLSDCKDLSNVQLNILESSSRSLQIGGELVYSTCTVTREENEEVINRFLSKNKNFMIKKDWLHFWPHIHMTDGFSMVTLCKVREE